MSYDFAAGKGGELVLQSAVQQALARSLGVPPDGPLHWQEEEQWVQVDLERTDEAGDSLPGNPGGAINQISIHVGNASYWKTWDKVMALVAAIRTATGWRTLDRQRGQYLDDIGHPGVAQAVPRATFGDLSADGRFLLLENGVLRVIDPCGLGRDEYPQLEGMGSAMFIGGGPRFVCTRGETWRTPCSLEVAIGELGQGGPVALFSDGWEKTPTNVRLGRGPLSGLWDSHGYVYLADGSRIRPYPFDGGSPTVTVSPDHSQVFDGARGLLDVGSGRPIAALPADHRVCCAAFSTDGSRLATAGREKRIFVWDTKTGESLSELRRCGEVACLHFLGDHRLLSGPGSGSTVRLWDLDARRSQPLKAPGSMPLAWEWPWHARTPAPAPVRESGRSVIDIIPLIAGKICIVTSDHQFALWDSERRLVLGMLGVLVGGAWLVLERNGRWDASDELEGLAWSWVTDARRYANFWFRDAQRGPRTRGLLQELMG